MVKSKQKMMMLANMAILISIQICVFCKDSPNFGMLHCKGVYPREYQDKEGCAKVFYYNKVMRTMAVAGSVLLR